MPNTIKMKGLQCKIILLCRLHNIKNVIHVIMDSHCLYQNYPTYLLAHEQIRLLSGDAIRLNGESALSRAQLALKGEWDMRL